MTFIPYVTGSLFMLVHKESYPLVCKYDTNHHDNTRGRGSQSAPPRKGLSFNTMKGTFFSLVGYCKQKFGSMKIRMPSADLLRGNLLILQTCCRQNQEQSMFPL